MLPLLLVPSLLLPRPVICNPPGFAAQRLGTLHRALELKSSRRGLDVCEAVQVATADLELVLPRA